MGITLSRDNTPAAGTPRLPALPLDPFRSIATGLLIGLLQHDPYKAPRESPRYGVRIVEPILDAMGIPHHLINEDADVAKIKPAIDTAHAKSFPVALLIGRRPSTS